VNYLRGEQKGYPHRVEKVRLFYHWGGNTGGKGPIWGEITTARENILYREGGKIRKEILHLGGGERKGGERLQEKGGGRGNMILTEGE